MIVKTWIADEIEFKSAKKYDDIEKSYIIEALGDNISLESLKKLKISN